MPLNMNLNMNRGDSLSVEDVGYLDYEPWRLRDESSMSQHSDVAYNQGPSPAQPGPHQERSFRDWTPDESTCHSSARQPHYRDVSSQKGRDQQFHSRRRYKDESAPTGERGPGIWCGTAPSGRHQQQGTGNTGPWQWVTSNWKTTDSALADEPENDKLDNFRITHDTPWNLHFESQAFDPSVGYFQAASQQTSSPIMWSGVRRPVRDASSRQHLDHRPVQDHQNLNILPVDSHTGGTPVVSRKWLNMHRSRASPQPAPTPLLQPQAMFEQPSQRHPVEAAFEPGEVEGYGIWPANPMPTDFGPFYPHTALRQQQSFDLHQFPPGPSYNIRDNMPDSRNIRDNLPDRRNIRDNMPDSSEKSCPPHWQEHAGSHTQPVESQRFLGGHRHGQHGVLNTPHPAVTGVSQRSDRLGTDVIDGIDSGDSVNPGGALEMHPRATYDYFHPRVGQMFGGWRQQQLQHQQQNQHQHMQHQGHPQRQLQQFQACVQDSFVQSVQDSIISGESLTGHKRAAADSHGPTGGQNEDREYQSHSPKKARAQMLNSEAASEIYKLRPAVMPPGTLMGVHAQKVARQYHVASNTVRDIWGRRTWVKATQHHWTRDEQQQYMTTLQKPRKGTLSVVLPQPASPPRSIAANGPSNPASPAKVDHDTKAGGS